MHDPLQTAARLQMQAHHVIDDLKIRIMWEKVGKTCLVGSVRFGLMTSANIDFEIYVDQPDPRAGFAVMQEIAAVPGVRRMSYFNFMGTDDPGLYWWFEYADAEGTVWDFDNWLVPFSHPHAGMADALATAMERVLTDRERRIILDIKKAVRGTDSNNKSAIAPEEKMSGPYVRGIDIYKAVLRDGIAAPEAFRDWLKNNPPAALETWHP
jgi:hypothetical protein